MAALSQDELKQQAAWKAVDYVKSGMVVGLGTGSTAAFAVDRIGQLMKEGTLKDIVGVPTSIRTYEQAKSLGIPLATLDEQPKIDVAIDGADEVDPKLDVVKGRGGALLREKMVEMASAKFVCIVDDTKLVEGLGGSKLAMPVEIVQFCHKYTLNRCGLEQLYSSVASRVVRQYMYCTWGHGSSKAGDSNSICIIAQSLGPRRFRSRAVSQQQPAC
jgi:ribose 5-phosphate isomerase A